jgi:hypothetical protein
VTFVDCERPSPVRPTGKWSVPKSADAALGMAVGWPHFLSAWPCRVARGRGGVSAEQGEGLRLGAIRFGVVDDQVLAGSAVDGQVLEAQRQFAHDRMVEVLDLGRVGPYLLAEPQPGEVGAFERQLTHELDQPRVVRVGVGRAQGRDAPLTDRGPVPVKRPGLRFEEDRTKRR